jgi:Cu-processing system permease protein
MIADVVRDRGRGGVTWKVMRYEVRDVLRSRWLIAYAGFFAVATDVLLRFGAGADDARTVVSLINVVLGIVPLVAVVFGTMYLYHSREFVELLLAQPVSRRQLFLGLYGGLAFPLSAAFALGVGLPFVLHGIAPEARSAVSTLVATGVVLTFVFTALAFVVAARVEDRARGLGAAIAVWLGLAVLYDGLVLMLATMFADYPIERGLLALMIANPIDLSRIVLLLQLDISALMGYTGAVFQHFFGNIGGVLLASGALLAWIGVPVCLAMRAFLRKDF